MKKYYIKTFGCQMNVYDSQRIAAILKSLGYAEASSLKNADLVILNTCHIREKAAEKVFSDLGRIELVRQERAAEGLDTVIGVVGCVVQAEDDQIAKRAPYVDFAAGPLTYHRLPEILAKVGRRRGHTVIDTEFPVESKFDFLPDNQSAGGCSYLAIQEGCNNFCTYCVVPYTRGVETSRPVEDIIREAKRLVEGGTVEINLLGQNVNSYHGEDSAGKERNLAHLLRRLNEIEGLQRIRYTTSYPADVDDDLIACHRDLPKLMPYLHLPIQSGSDSILKAMNRRHTSGQYLEIIERLREANPALGFSSDFIVGFPGETDADFQATLDVVNRVKFIQAFSFKYSRRAGTPAALMPNQVEEKIKKERLDILQDLLFSYQLKFNKESVGKVMPVLFDMKGRHKGQLIGRTPYMQNLHAELGKECLNRIINVKITDATTNSLSGVVEG
ncbi:MAG: tRNA (N6-isopentenyl adenosine(37)-C2)-methylthiotransferase MiaB [Alphaproteobacteria bacterium]|nr:tRNA (N6-isopentenyl adenosine(37)-C2)-methylthiotransferase MiaB [Pseudomonadota bacterium]CCZ29774.1 (Dimethylallyl)adenosine tRNA methylthiotransferase MiaB [Proteobacteria bacterium CAG:495]